MAESPPASRQDSLYGTPLFFYGCHNAQKEDFRLTTMIRVADALGVTLSELFTGLEHGEPVSSKRVQSGTRP